MMRRGGFWNRGKQIWGFCEAFSSFVFFNEFYLVDVVVFCVGGGGVIA